MRLQRILSASVILAIVTLVASTGFGRAEAGDTSRPFKGTAEGVVTEIVDPAHWIIDYVGTATHLGQFTRREHITFTGPGTFEGTITYVAADGDELESSFSGQFDSPNEASGIYTFTGGTGRFSDAQGSAAFSAFTPDFVHVSVTFDGTIDY